MYTINPDTLTQDILVFLSDDITQPCSAHIWLKHPEHQKELCSLLEKRNITTTIYPL
jgi:hypothetical protein